MLVLLVRKTVLKRTLCDGENVDVAGTENPELKDLSWFLLRARTSSLSVIIPVYGLELQLSTEISHYMTGID